jgi:hypothetical protein
MPLSRCAPCDSPDHVQIAQQLFPCAHAYRIFVLDLTPGAQKELRIVDDAVLYIDWALAPGGVELADFLSCELMVGNLLGKALAVVSFGARHRHQVLHGRLRADLSEADVLLDRLG